MHKNRQTLVILTPGFPANEADSNCLPFPQSFVQNLKRLHPQLHIIVLAFHYPFVAGSYQWHGIDVRSFNGKDKGRLRRLKTWYAVWQALKIIVREKNILGFLNFWLGECALLGSYAARRYKLPCFTWMLGQDARKHNRYLPLIKPSAASLVALSDAVADELYRNYGIRPAHTIPAGVDTAMYAKEDRERSIHIMGAGSLIPLKQYDQFIHIVARLVVNQPSLKVILCGDGPEKQRLQQLINAYELNTHIELAGVQDHGRILELMQASKIFLHTSSYEGFSTVCAEALYAGAQVISYCKPMETGFNHLHIVEDADAMADKAEALLADASHDHHPVLTYPIEECCKKILALYN